MPTIEEILTQYPYSELKELKEIRRFIREKIFKTLIIDQEKLAEAMRHTNNKYYISDGLMNNSLDVVLYSVVQKIISTQPYRLNGVEKAVDIIEECQSDAKKKISENYSYLSEARMSDLLKKLDEIMLNKDKEYEEMPAEHCILWSLSKTLKPRNYDLSAYINFFRGFQSFERITEQFTPVFNGMKNTMFGWFNQSTYKNFYFEKPLTDVTSVSGNIYLLLDGSSSEKASIFESVNNRALDDIDLVFKMLFYAFLHNKFNLKTWRKNKIEKFGFLNWECNFCYICDYKMSRTLKDLFGQLYKKIKQHDFAPPNLHDRFLIFWEDHGFATKIISSFISVTVALVVTTVIKLSSGSG